MDVCQLKQLIRFAAKSSLILLGSTAALAGDRPHEQPTRPHMSATCAPNWGFNQTCWSRFPALPPCPGAGCNTVSAGYDNFPSQSQMYVPQDVMISPDTQFTSPAYGSVQGPVSVFPNLSSPAAEASPQFGPSSPTEFPARPQEHAAPFSPVPATPFGLPPLPTPAPGQTSIRPNMMIGPNHQVMERPVLDSNQSVQSSVRYGIPARPHLPAPGTVPMSSMSRTNALLVTNTQAMPMREQTPPQVMRQISSSTYSAHHLPSHSAATATMGGRYGIAPPPQDMSAAKFATSNTQSSAGRYGSLVNSNGPTTLRIPVSAASQTRARPEGPGSTTYRSGRSMPPVPAAVHPVFQPSHLPPMSNQPSIPVEPLRSTP